MTSRRSFLAASGLSLALQAPDARAAVADGAAIENLVRLSEASNAALMKGDIAAYTSMITLSPDFTLFSPFGGPPTRGPVPQERIEAMGRFFRNGSHRQDLIASYGGADMVVLALIERSHVEVGGLPAQDWALRVTLVYRRDGDDWRLVHRHADPIVESMSLSQAAEIGRGERRQ